jgi:hypothetical protein
MGSMELIPLNKHVHKHLLQGVVRARLLGNEEALYSLEKALGYFPIYSKAGIHADQPKGQLLSMDGTARHGV